VQVSQARPAAEIGATKILRTSQIREYLVEKRSFRWADE
jgi:hypothetical protein